jgi:FkbM family methyltransferase
VGSAVRGKPNPRDIDIVAIMGKEEFQFAHGFTQQSLHAAHKERPESPKLKRWRHDCSVVERALASLLGHKVDFKWLPQSMLYKPNKRIQINYESLRSTSVFLSQGDTPRGTIYDPSFWCNVEPDFLYVDVGACIGNTIMATGKMYPDIDIIAIDPLKRHFPPLNHVAQQLKNKVSIINKGAWSQRGQLTIHVNPTHSAGSTMMKKNITPKHNEPVTVQVDTVDSLVKGAGYDKVDLIKIDVEGAEHKVLQGFKDTVNRTQFHIEYHENLGMVLGELATRDLDFLKIYASGIGGSIYGRFN